MVILNLYLSSTKCGLAPAFGETKAHSVTTIQNDTNGYC